MAIAQDEPFLAPIEKPAGFFKKLAYAASRRQFGKVLTPLKITFARLPIGFGLFGAKIAKLDKKLTLPPETVLLIRERVARLNVCLFCIDIGRAMAIKQSMNEAKFDALEDYRTSPLFSDAERAALDYVTELTEHKQRRSRHLSADGRSFFGPRNLRDRVAGGERAFLQHDQHRPEHPFRHALRYWPAAEVGPHSRGVIATA